MGILIYQTKDQNFYSRLHIKEFAIILQFQHFDCAINSQFYYHQKEYTIKILYMLCFINPLSAKFIKWSNTLKQIVGNLPTICLSMFDHFSGLAFKGSN